MVCSRSGSRFGDRQGLTVSPAVNHCFLAQIVLYVLTITSSFAETRSIVPPRLILVDAKNGDEIIELTDLSTINLAALPTRELNVRLDSEGAKILRVTFGYDERPVYRKETSAPFFLAGNVGSKINKWTPSVGVHLITAKIDSLEPNGRQSSERIELLFKVVHEKVETPNPAPTIAGDVALTSGGISVTPKISQASGPVAPRSATAVLLPTYRINAGGDSFIDESGNFWQSDFGLSAAATFGSSSHAGNILGLGVYHSGRSSSLGPLEYHLPLPAGRYRITVHVMEPYLASKGKCIFDVVLEDEIKIPNIDPIELAGSGKPLARSVLVSVTDGTLDISFRPQRGFAIVNGLEIQPALGLE